MTDRIKTLLETANDLLSTGQWRSAVDLYSQLACLCPDKPDVHHVHGLALEQIGSHDAALDCIGRAISLNTQHYVYHRSRGDVLQAAGRLEEAIKAYRQALNLCPDDVETMINMGNAWHRLNFPDNARHWFQKVLSIEASNVKAINNIGKTFFDENRINAACRWYQKALTIDTTYAEARFNRAVALLAMGDFQNGWREYEWRFNRASAHRVYPHVLMGTRWNGASFKDRRLLVHCEQGMGDVIQFCRYLPMVKALGGTLVVEAHRPLIPLLSTMNCIDQVIAFDALTAPQIPYDLHIPMMSLPLLFQTQAETIPNQVPYLFADAGNTARWRSRISFGDLRVGIVWAGSTTDPQRACSLEQILTWFSAPRVHFYSLQKEITEHQSKAMSEVKHITHLGNQFNDFGDTASVIANLDLVISVDTAVAHLAGAMGKPVWILLPSTPDWRWQLIGNTSAWYPSARLFRQKKKADWQPVIESIGQALIHLASSHVNLQNNDHAQGHTPPLDSMEFRIFKSGQKHFDCGNFEQAVAAFQTVISQTPQFDQAYFMLGRALHELGRWKKAIWAYLEATRLNHDFAESYRNLGLAFHQIGDLIKSAHNYEQALRLQPQQAAVLSNLGAVYNQLNKPDAAADCYRKALSIDPTYADAHYNLGNLNLNQGNLDQAITCYTKTLALNPLHLHAIGNMGRAHHRKGQLGQAMIFYENALSINPEDPTTRLNRAVTLLLKGDWKAGWQEYEWRFKQHDWYRTYPHRLAGPRWYGETFHNKTLLIHCEQGIGDALQFARFVPMVKSRGGRIVFQVRRSLMSLFKTIQCVDDFIELSAEKPPKVQYELHTPLCSLAGIFNIQPSCIPNRVPYLCVDEKKAFTWGKRVKQEGMNVGLVWAGSNTYPERACNFKDFASLHRLRNINWIGLQKGPAAAQVDEKMSKQGLTITNWGNDFQDFSDTAAAIANLDLVISIDTSVAHLAGALGKPVWLLLPKVADWRWLMTGDRSPWYPTMRLFRQSRHGSWDTVITAVFRKMQSMTPAKLRRQNDEDKKQVSARKLHVF